MDRASICEVYIMILGQLYYTNRSIYDVKKSRTYTSVELMIVAESDKYMYIVDIYSYYHNYYKCRCTIIILLNL